MEDSRDIDWTSPSSPVPTLYLSLEPEQLEAEVTQSREGAVTFNGTMTVDQPPLLTSTVTLSSEINTGWPTSLSEETFNFTGSGEETFEVTVNVPGCTSSLLMGNLVVRGSCKAPRLAPVEAECRAVVTVSQYHKVAMEFQDGALVESKRGESHDIAAEVKNHGNGNEEITISIIELPDDVIVTVSRDRLTIHADGSEEVTIRVEVSDDAEFGRKTVVIQIDAAGVDGPQRTYEVFVEVESFVDEIPIPLSVTTVILAIVAASLVVAWRRGMLGRRTSERIR